MELMAVMTWNHGHCIMAILIVVAQVVSRQFHNPYDVIGTAKLSEPKISKQVSSASVSLPLLSRYVKISKILRTIFVQI